LKRDPSSTPVSECFTHKESVADAPRVTPARESGPPVQKAEDAVALPSYRGSVVFYAVVSDEIHQVIEFFNTPGEAEAMLETVLEDEPEWRETLYIECVEFVTGRAELARRRRSAARAEA
jgi:hypothetical protein